MIDRFHLIEDAACILYSRGVYRQVKVFRHGRDVFAGYGAGFVKLGPHGGTSHPHVAWRGVEGEGITCERPGGQPGFTLTVSEAA